MISNADKITNLATSTGPHLIEDDEAEESAPPKTSINEYHEEIGHPSFATTRATAKANNVELAGQTKPCDTCAISKAQQKKISKTETVPRAKKPAERLFLDISSQPHRSLGGNKHWLLVVDDATDNCFSFFLKSKDKTAEVLIPFLKDLHARLGRGMEYIRCDNAGENLALKCKCEKAGLGIKFELTAPNTPQQNWRVERKFATLWGRVRAMMEGANLSRVLLKGLWTEAANTATDLDNYFPDKEGKQNLASNFFGKGYKSIIDSPKIFGEACIVTNRKKIKAKLDDRGIPCIWLGYAKDHKAGTYCMYSTTTGKCILTRDVIFLRKTYAEFKQDKNKLNSQTPNLSKIVEQNDNEQRIPDLISYYDSDSNSNDEDEDNDTPSLYPSLSPSPSPVPAPAPAPASW